MLQYTINIHISLSEYYEYCTSIDTIPLLPLLAKLPKYFLTLMKYVIVSNSEFTNILYMNSYYQLSFYACEKYSDFLKNNYTPNLVSLGSSFNKLS